MLVVALCLQMSDKMILNASFNWLVWSRDKFSDLENANLNIDSEVTWATPENDTNFISLYDLYKINYSWPVTSIVAGTWDTTAGLQYSLPLFKYSRRADLQGVMFKAAVLVSRL